MEDKLVNWYIYGPPDVGKTKWVHTTFGGRRAFCAPATTDYPLEGYNNEPVIIYDDFVPSWPTILQLSNVSHVKTEYPGKVRYIRKYLD